MIRGEGGEPIRSEADLFKIIVLVWKKIADIMAKRRVGVGVGVGIGIGISGPEKP